MTSLKRTRTYGYYTVIGRGMHVLSDTTRTYVKDNCLTFTYFVYRVILYVPCYYAFLNHGELMKVMHIVYTYYLRRHAHIRPSARTLIISFITYRSIVIIPPLHSKFLCQKTLMNTVTEFSCCFYLGKTRVFWPLHSNFSGMTLYVFVKHRRVILEEIKIYDFTYEPRTCYLSLL